MGERDLYRDVKLVYQPGNILSDSNILESKLNKGLFDNPKSVELKGLMKETMYIYHTFV